MKLEINEIPTGQPGSMKTMRIGGFAEGELERLKRIPHQEAREKLLDMLDERNGKIGTAWQCGYCVYGMWFDNEYAYINIGTNCD